MSLYYTPHTHTHTHTHAHTHTHTHVGHMVKNHSDGQRNPLPPLHGILFSITSK